MAELNNKSNNESNNEYKKDSNKDSKKEKQIITSKTRKAIKVMAQISQCSKALKLMPKPEDFALRIIGDLRRVGRMVNNISKRLDEILDKYASIPGEFLLKGFDEILEKLEDINDYAKFAIKETTDIMTKTVESAEGIVEAVESATTNVTSAVLQVGGGLAYDTVAMGANIKLALSGADDGRTVVINYDSVNVSEINQEIENAVEKEVGKIDDAADAIKDWTETAIKDSTDTTKDFYDDVKGGLKDAKEWIEDTKEEDAYKLVDDSVGALIKKVENAKKDIEDKIKEVKEIFNDFVKNFDNEFGFVNGKNFAEDAFSHISSTATSAAKGSDNKDVSKVFNEIADLSDDVANFIKNFNIGKVVASIGALTIGAGAAVLAMDLLPEIDIDKMLKKIIGGIEENRIRKIKELNKNKVNGTEPDLLEVPDYPWLLSKDDLEKYNADAYNKFLEDYALTNDEIRKGIYERMQKATTKLEISAITKENKELMKKNKSALKAMRKIRRDAIKARQIGKYKNLLKTELNYLKNECVNMRKNIKSEWDTMMEQYNNAIIEIEKFFNNPGKGGNETIDRCCDRINEDGKEIVELCDSISEELSNTVSSISIPYSIGSCVDMPVHKILSFFKDVKIIVTFLRNLIRLGIDIISQITILAKIISDGVKDVAEIIKTLMDLLGIDFIMSMIDSIVSLFRSKMIDAKILLENSISPVYYNETEEYEAKVEALESLLEDDKSGGNIEVFKYTDDINARKKYKEKEFGGVMKDDEEIEEALEELEAKGEREIVAYRSPILNTEGDGFAGWIFYHADAYDNMNDGWSSAKKRRRNRLIKKASKKNKMRMGKLVGGVAQLKHTMRFGKIVETKYVGNSVNGYDAYYWYTKWTSDPTDCKPDKSNEDGKDVVSPKQITSNGSLVELSDGRRVFVEGKTVKSGDYVSVDGVKYRVK